MIDTMNCGHERFTLNRFCEFTDREIEAEYMEFERRASLNVICFLMLFMGFVFGSFAVSDYFFYNDGGSFITSLALRAAAFFIAVAASFLVKRFDNYRHALILLSLAELTVFIIYLVNLSLIENHPISLQFMTIMLFIFAVFIIPNRWKYCFAVNCVILAGYILFCVVKKDSAGLPTLTQRAIYLSITFWLCAFSTFSREKSRRRQFTAEKLLEYMSITDALTGIYNRGRFEYTLGLWIKNMRHDPFCLILFDIDNFKVVNDVFGHVTGDCVLVETSKLVASSIRDNDVFARWGGEEFVILFSRTKIDRAAELAERLRKAVEVHSCGEAGKITISIGVVEYRRGEDIQQLVKRADAKMYEAKQAGKNRIMVD